MISCLSLVACGNGNAKQEREKEDSGVADKEKVEVLYFHGKRGALHSGVQDGQGSQSSDRRHERRDGACIVRFHLYARNGRERAETVCRHPSFGYTVATV